jgi:glucosyl-3-phosphoglycerate synthase
MVDFHQEGTIATLHGLYELFEGEEYLQYIDRKLELYSKDVKIALLLPCLYTELKQPDVIGRIMDEISRVRYLHSVVVAFGGTTDESMFHEARDSFRCLEDNGCHVAVVWVDGPRVQRVFDEMASRNIPVGERGKGQSVWISLGYIFAQSECRVIALHDCDILTYSRVMLARIIEPVANPNSDFQFAKGYYPRISTTERVLKGRVSRLFVSPFCDVMARIMRDSGFPDLEGFFKYHGAFKYPLSGEFSFTSHLARSLDFAYDWGLEVATLSEVYKRTNLRKISQVAIADNYDHKHQKLSPEDPGKGLHKMVVDISKFYFNYMRSHGVPIDNAYVDMVCHSYYENAKKFIKIYSDDADINAVVYDRHEEELSARYFRDFIATGWEQCRESLDNAMLPSWNRILYSVPDLYEQLLSAVEEDNR